MAHPGDGPPAVRNDEQRTACRGHAAAAATDPATRPGLDTRRHPARDPGVEPALRGTSRPGGLGAGKSATAEPSLAGAALSGWRLAAPLDGPQKLWDIG